MTLSASAIIAMGAASGYPIPPELAEALFEITQQVERPIPLQPDCSVTLECGAVKVTYSAPTPEALLEVRASMEEYDKKDLK